MKYASKTLKALFRAGQLMGNPLVLGGSNSRHIAFDLSNELKADYYPVEVKRFPDDELYVRLPADVKGREVIYVNSLQPDPNSSLMESFLSIDAIRKHEAKRVVAVIPYMAYARQDEEFNAGEAVSAFTVGRLFQSLSVDYIITVDMHLHRITDPRRTFGAIIRNITGVKELTEHVKANVDYKNAIVVGPDEEAEQWARKMAEGLGLGHVVLKKRRLSGSEVEVRGELNEVKDKDVIMVDDIISTGGTIIEATKLLRGAGAKRVHVTCVHPILVQGAYFRLRELGLETLAGTDTVLSPISVVRISPAIAEELRNIL